MTTIRTGIGLLVIAVAAIILIFTFRKFVFPAVGEFAVATGNALGDIGEGFTDFFSSFDKTEQQKKDEAEIEKNKHALDVYDEQVKQKEKEAKEKGYASVEDYEKATDPNNDPLKFNPDGIIGYGYPELNGGRGIPDTPQNRIVLERFIKTRNSFEREGTTTVDESGNFLSFDFEGFGTIPEAYAEESNTVNIGEHGPIEVKKESLDINKQTVDLLNPETKTKPQEKIIDSKPQGASTIEGVVRNNIGTTQNFEVFSSDSSRPVFGTINPTPQDPKKLKTDSNKVPIETASERANRVFIETGDFADVNRGATSTKIRDAFDFGTNTGKGSKLPTVNKGGTTGSAIGNKIVEERIAQLKKIQEERAKAIFNSGAIQKL